MSENSSARGRLDSWKEIAEYLKRDIRTAIRWGKDKGMPVHRVPGGKRQAVFAYKDEIDGWMTSQEAQGKTVVPATEPSGPIDDPANLAAAESQHRAAHLADSGPAPARSHQLWLMRTLPGKRRAFLIAGVFILGAAGIAGVLMARSSNSAAVHPFSLKKITDNGRVQGRIRTDGVTLYFNEGEGMRYILASAPISGSPIRPIDTPFSDVLLQDLSNDNKTLLVTSHEGTMLEGPLWTVPAQGGTPARVGDAVCNSAAWSPDNHEIACARRTTIILMDADGSNARTALAFSLPVGEVAWTPDGKNLQYVLDDFTAHTCSQWEVAVRPNSAPGRLQRALLGPDVCTSWSWTRDGSVAWYVDADAAGKTRLMMAAGSAPATELPVRIGALSRVTAARGSDDLFLLISSTPALELLMFDQKRHVLQPAFTGLSGVYIAFSPDSRWITYVDAKDQSLWRSRADGSERLQLGEPSMEVEVSSWSPDGRRIAFMGRKPGTPYRIYVVDRDGGALQALTEGTDNQGGPSWSPDGKSLVYGNTHCEGMQDCWVRRVDLKTRKTYILPGSNGFRTARWSPNGRYIAALRFQAHELMLFDVAQQRWRTLAGSITGDNVNWSRDSQEIYVDSPRDAKPIIERIRIRDGKRTMVLPLAFFHNGPGTFSGWFGLTPDDSPLLGRKFSTSDVYRLEWIDR